MSLIPSAALLSVSSSISTPCFCSGLVTSASPRLAGLRLPSSDHVFGKANGTVIRSEIACNSTEIGDSSPDSAMPSSFPMEVKTNSIAGPRRSASARTPSRIREMGPLCRPRDGAAAALLKPAGQYDDDDRVDFDALFQEKGWVDDEKESLWLSSGNSSPSSCLEDQRFSVLLDSTVDCWVIPDLASLAANPSSLMAETESIITGFFDSSRLNPIEEETQMLQEDDHQTVLDNSSSPFGNKTDSVSGSCDSEAELDRILLGFPCPSCHGSWDSDVARSSSSSPLSSSAEPSEPIFWPNDGRFEWGKWDFFIMSPRKQIADMLGLVRSHESKLVGKTKTKFSEKIESLGPSSDEEEFASNAVVVPIESLLGLEEFDGHEGIDLEFNKDEFSLDGSL